jgi:ABC-type amino acid transport substrate-binding protein
VVGAFILFFPRPERHVEQASADVHTVEEDVLTVVAVPAPPYSIPGAAGPVGFDVDVVTEVARRMGLEARVAPAEEGDPFASLVARDTDVVVAGTAITGDLESRVNLSVPYLRLLQTVVVNADVRPDLAGLDDLVEGDEVAVIEGSTGHAWATTSLEPEAIELDPYPNVEAAAVALAAGAVDTLVATEVEAMAAAGARPSLRVVETLPTGEGLGIAVDPQNGDLLAAVNEALADMAADGTYDRIFDRYEAVLPPGGRITAG